MVDSTAKRKVEIQTPSGWVTSEMKNLKKGNVFRMSNPGEDTPFGMWEATSDASKTFNGLNDETVWGVNCEVINL